MSLNHDLSTKPHLRLPNFDELPHYKDFSGCAWGVWPDDDELGTINLLTEEVVLRAAKEEIRLVAGISPCGFAWLSLLDCCRTGKHISLNW